MTGLAVSVILLRARGAIKRQVFFLLVEFGKIDTLKIAAVFVTVMTRTLN